MTAPKTTTREKDNELRKAVVALISLLQRQHLAGEPAAAGRLAVLRRAIQQPAGSVPEAWESTIGILPEPLLGRGDAPSYWERAAHAAVTLYALHQQAQSRSMHRAGSNLGAAIRDLRRLRGAEVGKVDPVLRRFHALATANSFDELLHHLRGLVTLLRDAKIPLDYGRLAVDLRRLQTPYDISTVRLSWARSLYQHGSPQDQPPATEVQELPQDTPSISGVPA